MRFSIVENVAMSDDIIFKISRGSQRPYGAKSKKSDYLPIFVLLDPSLLSPYGGLYGIYIFIKLDPSLLSPYGGLYV